MTKIIKQPENDEAMIIIRRIKTAAHSRHADIKTALQMLTLRIIKLEQGLTKEPKPESKPKADLTPVGDMVGKLIDDLKKEKKDD